MSTPARGCVCGWGKNVENPKYAEWYLHWQNCPQVAIWIRTWAHRMATQRNAQARLEHQVPSHDDGLFDPSR